MDSLKRACSGEHRSEPQDSPQRPARQPRLRRLSKVGSVISHAGSALADSIMHKVRFTSFVDVSSEEDHGEDDEEEDDDGGGDSSGSFPRMISQSQSVGKARDHLKSNSSSQHSGRFSSLSNTAKRFSGEHDRRVSTTDVLAQVTEDINGKPYRLHWKCKEDPCARADGNESPMREIRGVAMAAHDTSASDAARLRRSRRNISSGHERSSSVDKYSRDAWADWESTTMWRGYTQHRGIPAAERKPTHDAEVEHGDCLEGQQNDMTFDDLERTVLTQKEDAWIKDRKWSNEDTAAHEICRKDNFVSLIKRLRTGAVVEHRTEYFGDEAQFSVIRKRYLDPKSEVYQPNYTGQLPLHIAAQSVKYIEEIDGSKQRMEAAYQTAPDLCTLLLTGLDPRNGDKVFSVERDAKGYAIPCMYQDGTGMTPLHAACMTRTSLSYELVARLLEANPMAARVRDMDGMLPLDLVCMNSAKGASDVVKMLLRAYPEAAIVSQEPWDDKSMEADWKRCAKLANDAEIAKNEDDGSSQRLSRARSDDEQSTRGFDLVSPAPQKPPLVAAIGRSRSDEGGIPSENLQSQSPKQALIGRSRSSDENVGQPGFPFRKPALKKPLSSSGSIREAAAHAEVELVDGGGSSPVARSGRQSVDSTEGIAEGSHGAAHRINKQTSFSSKSSFKEGLKASMDALLGKEGGGLSKMASFSSFRSLGRSHVSRSESMRSVNINASYAQASKETVRKLVNTQSLFARTGSAGTVATGLEASESNWSRSREREYLSYVQCALGSVIDGIVISRGKREIRNNSFKTDLEVMDLKYMSPQITMLQQMLIDVSSCYRPGNFATPGPLSLMTHAMLKDRLVNDFPRRASQTKNMTLANIARTFSKSNLRLDKGFKGGAAPDADSSSFYDNNVAEGNNEPKGVIRDARLSPHGNDRYLWVKDLFESLVDEEGNLDYEDVCGGFSLLGIPISLEEAEELVEEGDPFNTGVLSLEKIGVLCDRVILVDDMVRGLQREWGQSTFYMQRDLQGGTFMEKITKALVDTKQMQRCIMTARMQDPASRPVSFVPYRIEECFYDDEVHRRSETVQSTKQKVSVNGSSSSKKPPAFISQRDLQRRMDSPDPAISLFTRLPLHFACANSSNPEAGQMVRDVLCSYGGAARIADRKGRLPLHVAAMNESFACVTMVKLLLEEYPDATMVPDADGELPIHLCLRHNHGDGAFQVVVFLLDARRSCAGVASGLSLKGDFPTKELPAHLAISNYCRWNHRIIRAVISAYPTALSSTDEAGATILHRFSWTPHPSPHATERALEVERGITSHLRAPRKAGEENRRFDPVKMLDELVRCSVRFNPELLHTTDMYGAMPLHYVCQNKSPCARMIANELLRLHPSASMLVDVNGNTPLHMALGSKNSAVAEVIAEQHQTNLFNVPNLRNVTPSEVRGAWQVLSLFRPPSFYESLVHMLMSLSSPTLAGLTLLLAYEYYQSSMPLETALAVIPLALLAFAGIYAETVNLMNRVWEGGFQRVASYGDMLPVLFVSIAQFHVPLIGIVTMPWIFGERQNVKEQKEAGQAYVRLRTFFWLKSCEKIAVALPLGILHLCILLRHAFAREKMALGTPGDFERGDRDVLVSESVRSYQLAIIAMCCCVIAVSGANSESYRFWFDPHNPYMRILETASTLVLRLAEAASRITVGALVTVVFGVNALFIVIAAEVGIIIIISGGLFSAINHPGEFCSFIGREIFDLCGTYNGLCIGGFSQDDKTRLLGQANVRDSSIKVVVKTVLHICVRGAVIFQLHTSRLIDIYGWNFNWLAALLLADGITLLSIPFFFWMRLELYRMRRNQMQAQRKTAKLAAYTIPLFEQTSKDFLLEINENLQECHFCVGTYMMRKDEEDYSMHLLLSGEATIFTGGKRWMPSSNWPIVDINDMLEGKTRKGKAMSLVYKGSIIGDSDLIFMTKRRVNIVARTEVSTLALTRSAYNSVLARHPADAEQVAANAERLLGSRMNKSKHELHAAALSGTEASADVVYRNVSPGKIAGNSRARVKSGAKSNILKKSLSISRTRSSKGLAAALREANRMPEASHLISSYASIGRGRLVAPDIDLVPPGTLVQQLMFDKRDLWDGMEGRLVYDICGCLGVEGRHVAIRKQQEEDKEDGVVIEVAIVKDDPESEVDRHHHSRAIHMNSQELHIRTLLDAIDEDKDRVYSSRPCKYVCFKLVKKTPAACAAGSADEADTLRWTTRDARFNGEYESCSNSPLQSILFDSDVAGPPMSPIKGFEGGEESKKNATGVFLLPPPLVAVAGDHEEGSMDLQAAGTGGDTPQILPMVPGSESRRVGSTEGDSAACGAEFIASASSETMII